MTANTMKVEEQVRDLLCTGDADTWDWGGGSNPWSWGGAVDWLHFKRNGTGAIMCIGEQPCWCGVVEFDWSFKHQAGEAVVTNNGDTVQCTIEITLSTRLHPMYHEKSSSYLDIPLQDHLRNPPPPSKAPFSWAPLKPAAFQPKLYSLTLSRGRFILPHDIYYKPSFPFIKRKSWDLRSPSRYRSRLVFQNISPYPLLEEWDHMNGRINDVERHRYWERKEFVRDEIEYGDQTWGETLSWWFDPLAGTGTRSEGDEQM